MYDIDLNVQYSNNQEFRQCLRDVFKMDCVYDKNNDELDEETKDELLYDGKSVSNTIDFILERTQENSLFKDLYEIAASKMFSRDIGIGLSILFCYDNFYLFHILLKEFFQDPSSITSNSKSFIDLKKHIE